MHIYCQRQRCSPRSVVFGDISLMPIFIVVRWCQMRVWLSKMRVFSFDRYIFRMMISSVWWYLPYDDIFRMMISSVWCFPLALHIKIYTTSHGFPATARLLSSVQVPSVIRLCHSLSKKSCQIMCSKSCATSWPVPVRLDSNWHRCLQSDTKKTHKLNIFLTLKYHSQNLNS